jgi:hypothetical protein
MIRKLLLGTVAGLTLSSVVLAQPVNVVPQVGMISSIIRNPTYVAASVGLVPAASATDIFCIAASATKSISVRRIVIGGTAGTAITTPFLLYRRATVDTDGTPATALALPVGVAHLSSDPASTATLVAYTANPTITDASPGLLGAMLVDLPVTTAAGGRVDVERVFGTGGVDMFSKGLDLLRGSTQQLCVNLNGVSVSSGVLTITAEWTEQ